MMLWGMPVFEHLRVVAVVILPWRALCVPFVVSVVNKVIGAECAQQHIAAGDVKACPNKQFILK